MNLTHGAADPAKGTRTGRPSLWKAGLSAAVAAGLAAVLSGCGTAGSSEKLLDFKQINLVSSVDGIAPNSDDKLTDAWGLEFGDPGRVWVNANSGYSIVYDGTGKVIQVKDAKHPGQTVDLRVQIPVDPKATPIGGPAPLTGMIFNPLHGKPGSPFEGDAFAFVSEQGVIAGWQPLADGTDPLNAKIRVDNFAAGAVYKGVTSMQTAAGWQLYVANLGQGTVDVFDAKYQPVKNDDAFQDPSLPVGYAPFNIKAIGGKFYVTYAVQAIDKANDVKGPGNGLLDVYDADGKFIKRLVTGGLLNSPWGLALAPAKYGPLAGKLLVGNFGDGYIHVYDPSSGEYVGTVAENGKALQIDDLWALTFGTDNGAGSSDQLFFSAGSSAESQGIFGQLLYLGVNVAADKTLTIYSGQHQQTVDALVAGFEKSSGIKVSVRSDDEGILANQIVQEGASSPADVFVTENSPALQFLANHKLLAAVDKTALASVPAQYSSSQGSWIGVSARVSALVYNTGKIKAVQLPAKLQDLALPQWKGKIALAPSETDFQPLVTAMLKLAGKDATVQWLKGLKANSDIYPDNESVTAAVNDGQSAVGLINHYYWYRLRDENGADKMHSALHYYAPADTGNLIDVAGAGIIASSHHQESAQKFLAYITSKEGQTILADSESYEYPLGSNVKPTKDLTAFETFHAPNVNLEDLGDGAAALQLLKEVGLL